MSTAGKKLLELIDSMTEANADAVVGDARALRLQLDERERDYFEMLYTKREALIGKPPSAP